MATKDGISNGTKVAVDDCSPDSFDSITEALKHNLWVERLSCSLRVSTSVTSSVTAGGRGKGGCRLRAFRRADALLPPPSFRRRSSNKTRSRPMAANTNVSNRFRSDNTDPKFVAQTPKVENNVRQLGDEPSSLSFGDLRAALPNVQVSPNQQKNRSGSSTDLTCSQQAALADDTSVEELAGYFDNMVHIPRKMSFMAEMMYT